MIVSAKNKYNHWVCVSCAMRRTSQLKSFSCALC